MASRLETLYNITQDLPFNPNQIKNTYNQLKDIDKQYKGWGLEGLAAEQIFNIAKNKFNIKPLKNIDFDLNRGRLTYSPNDTSKYWVQPESLVANKDGRYTPHGIKIGASWRF